MLSIIVDFKYTFMELNEIIAVFKQFRIKMTQIDRSKILNDKVGGEDAMFSLPKQQELLVVNVINNSVLCNSIEAFTLKDYLRIFKNENWTKEADCKYGDIIITDRDTHEVICHIDLKVADDGIHKVYYPQNRLFVGCITGYSFTYFTYYNVPENPPHIYWCMSFDGSQFIFVDAAKLKTAVGTNREIFKTDPETGKHYLPSAWLFKNENKICI